MTREDALAKMRSLRTEIEAAEGRLLDMKSTKTAIALLLGAVKDDTPISQKDVEDLAANLRQKGHS